MSDAVVKKDRSPSFPFISLRKAVSRLEEMHGAHRREPARLVTIAPTWGYAARSSGLLQTAAALKQYGLVEDAGSGEERRLKISDLGRRILSDTRPGAREQALKEAARNPRLFAEYIERWVPDFPDDRHCVSELELDRGFTPDAAKTFIKVLKITVKYAGIDDSDGLSSSPEDSAPEQDQEAAVQTPTLEQQQVPAQGFPSLMDTMMGPFGAKPLPQRLRVSTDGNRVQVVADLGNAGEIDKLIRILEANKALLEDASPDTAQ